MGFLDKATVQEAIEEMVEDEGWSQEMPLSWIQTKVHTEWSKHLDNSQSWVQPTDTQKILEAFENLRLKKIVALHNAGYTTSDGEYEVVEIHQELLAKGIEPIGYCFYHEQDLERAIDPEIGNLMLAYQKVDNTDDAETLRVGELVAEELRKVGLPVKWEGNVREKILIEPFHWKKVYDQNPRWEHRFILELLRG